MPMRALQDGLLREGTQVGRQPPPSTNTVATPRECDYTMFIETAQIDMRENWESVFPVCHAEVIKSLLIIQH